MEEAEYDLPEQQLLDFEPVVDITKRVCERYGICNCGAGESISCRAESVRIVIFRAVAPALSVRVTSVTSSREPNF
jgi:hypothetical protein